MATFDTANFSTLNGLINVQFRETDDFGHRYDVTKDGLSIGELTTRDNEPNVYYRHHIDSKNFLTAVTDSVREACEALADFHGARCGF